MADNWHGVHYPDDLTIPFCFIPDGAPEPTEWLARYPDHIRMPATFIPDPPRQPDPPPPPKPAGALAASAAAPARFSQWTTPKLAMTDAGEFVAGIPGLLTLLGVTRLAPSAPGAFSDQIESATHLHLSRPFAGEVGERSEPGEGACFVPGAPSPATQARGDLSRKRER